MVVLAYHAASAAGRESCIIQVKAGVQQMNQYRASSRRAKVDLGKLDPRKRHGDPEVLPAYLQRRAARAVGGTNTQSRQALKFNPRDLAERKLWSNYMAAYEDAISVTGTKGAPWYVVPANRKWYRNLVVAQVVVDVLDEI